jgi:DNA polymerase-1
LKLTYTDKLPLQIHPKTNRIHTSYHQAVTATGRLSSTDPNLQNIPIRSLEGRKIRSAFIAPSGYKIVAADYSQIELRIMAHLSQDKSLLEAFHLNQDIHLSTAARVFQVPLEQVTAEQRSHAKTINFGLLYGMSAFGLSKQLGLTRAEAEKQIESYFHFFPGVKRFMDQIVQSAKENGYVETLWGRRLYLPDINASNIASRRAAERAAINAPMQGTNADIIKLAMIQLHEWTKSSRKDVYMIMQVHDELIFEVPENDLPDLIDRIRTLMENIVTLSVPLRVNIGVGNNWDEAH